MKKILQLDSEQQSQEKSKISKFYLTINTNQTDVTLKPKLKQAFTLFYVNCENFFVWLEDGLPKLNKIVSISGEGSTEVGDIQHRVHFHAFLTVKHHTKIQLDYDKM